MQPAPKKRIKVSAGKGKERFGELVPSEEMQMISKGFVPKNTRWALSTSKEWIVSRNKRCIAEETIDVDILAKPVGDCTELCRVLCLFVVEARKVNGELYPAKTVFHLLAGLLRYSRSVEPTCPNFLDPKDARFRKLQGTMDTHFRKLRQDGIE